jgi:hypothetical protein
LFTIISAENVFVPAMVWLPVVLTNVSREVSPVPPLATARVPADAFDTSRAVTGIVMFPLPSNDVAVPVAPPEIAMVLAVASLVAVAALPVQEPEEPETFPVIEAFIVAGRFNVTLADPLTDTAVPVLVPSESEIDMFLAVPQLAVVIAEEPLKLVPLMFLDVFSVVAVAAFPSMEPVMTEENVLVPSMVSVPDL